MHYSISIQLYIYIEIDRNLVFYALHEFGLNLWNHVTKSMCMRPVIFFTEKKMKLKTHFQKNLSFINSSFSNKPFKSIFYIFLQFYLKLKLLSTLKLKWSIKSMYVYFLNSLIQMFLQHISSVHKFFTLILLQIVIYSPCIHVYD